MTRISVAVITLILSLGCHHIRELYSFDITQNFQNLPKVNESLEKTVKVLEGVFPKLFLGSNKIKDYGICLTPACVHAASKMLAQMDMRVDPCDDFYNFACGTFIKETNIPDEEVSVNTFSVIEDKLQEQLKNLVSQPINESEAEPFKLVKSLFKSCMNKTLIEKRGINHFQKILETLGGWPVVKGFTWNSFSWNWLQSIQDSRKYGYSTDHILSFSVYTDLQNSAKRVMYIDQATLGLSHEYLIEGMNDTIVQAYYSYMVDMAVLYGAKRTNAEKEMKESLEFEFALANISLPQEERRNMTALYNPMTIKELQLKYPYIQWLSYFNAILPKEVQVTDDATIIVSEPSFFDELGKLLNKTSKKTIANYLMWQVVRSSSYFLTENLRKRQLLFSTAVNGIQEQEPRWKECVDITSEYFPISVGALYVRKHFKKNSKAAAMDIVKRIKIEFEKILKTISWMEATTRKSAMAKVKKMTTHIGYPDELLDDKKIIEYYRDISVDDEKYFESIMKLNVIEQDRAYKKLRQPVNKIDWKDRAFPAEVNAFYDAIENSIQFPAGILQGQFFAANRPKYLNYGAIGSVIGHEITHGFDDEGRQFDLNGNLVDWWQEATESAFLEKAGCIIDQYGNFTDMQVNMSINGINTQGENIADNGGVKQAYLAYKKIVQEIGEEPKLPGLDFSPEQLFWLSAAQTSCAVSRPETMKMQITTGVHAPDQFRVLGSFSNMQDFSVDFKCAEGSPMNPVKKCVMW